MTRCRLAQRVEHNDVGTILLKQHHQRSHRVHVEKIRRIGYGALVLDVPPGAFRELTQGEVQALNRAAAGKKVERKKTLPEAAQLKKPVPPRKKAFRKRLT